MNLIVYLMPMSVVLAATSNAVNYLTGVNSIGAIVIPVGVLCGLVAAVYQSNKAGSLTLAITLLYLGTIISILNQERLYSSGDVIFSEVSIANSMLAVSSGIMLARVGSPRLHRVMMWLGIAVMAMLIAVVAVKLRDHKNIPGGTMLPVGAFILIGRLLVRKRLGLFDIASIVVLMLVGAHFADHRMMESAALLFGILTMLMIRYPSKKLRAAIPIFAVLLGITLVILISNFDSFSFMTDLDRMATERSGRRLRSGREIFWGMVVNAIRNAPFFGYGPATKAEEFTGMTLSAHNSFLQIGIRYGIFGIILIIVILFILILRAAKSNDKYSGALLSSYLTAVILHSSTETVLISGNFPIAYLTWVNFGLLIYCCNPAAFPFSARSKWSESTSDRDAIRHDRSTQISIGPDRRQPLPSREKRRTDA